MLRNDEREYNFFLIWTQVVGIHNMYSDPKNIQNVQIIYVEDPNIAQNSVALLCTTKFQLLYALNKYY